MEFEQVNDYDIFEKIGSGAMGDVYKAQKPGEREFVAIKVMSRELTKEGKNVARFKREISDTIKLKHPNIVSTREAGEIEGRPYSVMEYVEGVTVKELLSTLGGLEEQKSVEIVTQIAEALQYANNFNGLIHRDIKPENIVITNKKQAKLLDMGIAKSMDTNTKVTQMGMVIGSPGYMSPEQAQGEEILDTRSDIFSLGATLYHMVAGMPPFVGETPIDTLTNTVRNDPSPIEECNPKISAETREVVNRMLKKHREQRYQSFAELLEDLYSLKNIVPASTVSHVSSPKKQHKKFHNCYVPTAMDMLIAQISLHNKILSAEQLDILLQYQQNLALMGISLGFDAVLTKRGVLSLDKRAALLQVSDQFILDRGDELFVKAANELKLFDRWKSAWENLKQQGEKGIAARLMDHRMVEDSLTNKLSSNIRQSVEREEARGILKLALEKKIISRVEAQRCSQVYSEKVASGNYCSIDEIMLTQGLIDERGMKALLRSVRIGMITGKPAAFYLQSIEIG